MELLANILNRPLSKDERVIEAYLALLEELTPEECTRAFSRAAETQEFYPTPATLLRLAGREPEYARFSNKLALVALNDLYFLMRGYGPALLPIPGKILRDKDADGHVLMQPVREPSTPCPALPEDIERTLRVLGGTREIGLKIASNHIAAGSLTSVAENRETEKRWLTAWEIAHQ